MNLLLGEDLVETVEGGEVRVHHAREAQKDSGVLAVFHYVVSVCNGREDERRSRKGDMASVFMIDWLQGKSLGWPRAECAGGWDVRPGET